LQGVQHICQTLSRITVAVLIIFIATAAHKLRHNGERNIFIYPVESLGKFAGKIHGGKFGKFAGENSWEKSLRNLTIFGWQVHPWAWAPNQNKNKLT
jgi:hypothetical protein